MPVPFGASPLASVYCLLWSYPNRKKKKKAPEPVSHERGGYCQKDVSSSPLLFSALRIAPCIGSKDNNRLYFRFSHLISTII